MVLSTLHPNGTAKFSERVAKRVANATIGNTFNPGPGNWDSFVQVKREA